MDSDSRNLLSPEQSDNQATPTLESSDHHQIQLEEFSNSPDTSSTTHEKTELYNNRTKQDVTVLSGPASPNEEQEVAPKKHFRAQVVLILATMAYKFAFETMSGAVGLFVLLRFGSNGATVLAALLILYGICQSAFSSVLSQLVVRVTNVGRILAGILASMALLVSILLVMEAVSGGTRGTTAENLGSWPKALIFPIYMLFGGCVGMMEISRKVIPKQLLDDQLELKKLNAKIHIFYEVSGTIGAFLSTAMILYLGPIYALCHLPPFFVLSAILFWNTIPSGSTPPPSITTQQPKTLKEAFQTGVDMLIEYAYSIKEGGRLVMSDRRYWWLIFAFVIPQVLHRLIENLLFPVFSKKVLNNGSVSGIMLGGSNFGELLGALLVLLLSHRTKNPLIFSRIDAVLLGLCWVFAFIPSTNGGDSSFLIAGGIAPMMIFVSGFWAAGDISLLSYIQSSFSIHANESNGTEEDEPKPQKSNEGPSLEDILDEEEDAPPNSPLALAMGFLYACYALIVSILAFAFGRLFDYFDQQGDIHEGFFWISGVIFSCTAAMVFLATYVPRKEYFSSQVLAH